MAQPEYLSTLHLQLRTIMRMTPIIGVRPLNPDCVRLQILILLEAIVWLFHRLNTCAQEIFDKQNDHCMTEIQNRT